MLREPQSWPLHPLALCLGGPRLPHLSNRGQDSHSTCPLQVSGALAKFSPNPCPLWPGGDKRRPPALPDSLYQKPDLRPMHTAHVCADRHTFAHSDVHHILNTLRHTVHMSQHPDLTPTCAQVASYDSHTLQTNNHRFSCLSCDNQMVGFSQRATI